MCLCYQLVCIEEESIITLTREAGKAGKAGKAEKAGKAGKTGKKGKTKETGKTGVDRGNGESWG